jgi:hypothetical protein
MGEPLLSGEVAKNWTGVKEFHAFLSFGSSVLSTVQTREIVSIVRNSAGNYTVTLPRIYRQLVEVRFSLIDAAGALIFPVVRTNSVDSAGTLVFELCTETGTATDPDSGSKGMLVVAVSNDPFNDATI